MVAVSFLIAGWILRYAVEAIIIGLPLESAAHFEDRLYTTNN